jgi:hypothetical protein
MESLGRASLRRLSLFMNSNPREMETVRNESGRTKPQDYPWKIFSVLFIASILGVGAVLPYAFALLGKIISARTLPVSMPVLVVAQMIQSAILFGIVIFLGLLLARKVGLEMPILECWASSGKAEFPRGAFSIPLLSGAGIGGVIVFLLRFVFLPRIPQSPLASDAMISVWKRLLACFYGGINEELLMRLFFLSLVLWLLKKISRTKSLRPAPIIFWSANFIVALLFGASHLALVKFMMEITPMVLATILSLNGIAGLLFGYLYWKRGIEAAMLTHFSADIVLHVFGPMFLPV